MALDLLSTSQRTGVREPFRSRQNYNIQVTGINERIKHQTDE